MASIQTGGPDGVTLHGIELRRRYAGDVNPAGLRHGVGRYEFPNPAYTYEGDFRLGRKHGVGTFTTPDGGRYVGEFVDDEITGRGERVWGDGRAYVGTFTLGEMNGEGRLTRPDGGSYHGGWRANRRHGRGVDTHGPSGDTYDGEWVHGKRHGVGVAVLRSAGDETYDGSWERDERHGEGRMENRSSGESYAGGWRDGKRHGVGVGHHVLSGGVSGASSTAAFVDYEGEYVDDVPIAIPTVCQLEVLTPRPPRGDDEPEPEVAEGEDPPEWGTGLDPMVVVQGERVPGPLRLTVRTAYVPPAEGGEGAKSGDSSPGFGGDGDGEAGEDAAVEDAAQDAAAGDADDTAETPPEPPKLGPVATHETGRTFRCFLRAGAPEQDGADPDASGDSNSADSPDTSTDKGAVGWSYGRWTYGDEVHVANNEDWTFTTSSGECDVDGVAIGEDVEPGIYTLEMRDITPGWYGSLGRCNSTHVVLDVRAKPETEGDDGDGAAAE